MYEQILYEVDDPVATITLNRPDVLNAWTNRMGVEVRHAVMQAAADPAVVVIVLTGAGRGFCAGADLKDLSAIAGEGGGAWGQDPIPPEMFVTGGEESWGEDFRGEYTYLLSVPKPIIAAINGPVAGMAVPIALSCDLRFMAEEAVLTFAFSQRGLIAEWGASWLAPRLIGPSAALDLLWSSRKIGGAEALRLGLVNRSVPGAELAATVRAYAVELAERCSPASMAVMKRQVYQQLHAGLGAAEREAFNLMTASFSRPDFGEGVQSFLQRRPARFARLGPDGAPGVTRP